MGLTSRARPRENHSSRQRRAARQASGGGPEVSDAILDAVVLYARTLGVPARRRRAEGEADLRRGQHLFAQARCDACHRPELTTGDSPNLPDLAAQPIRPYSDLLLHDMGEGLSDGRPSFAASGAEWRTAPLWGLGLVPRVNGHSFLLHDGRARDVAEAILWHDGEGKPAQQAFVQMSREDRRALITFVESL